MKQSLQVLSLALIALAVAVPAWAVPAVPEIDPGTATAGVAALVSGVLVLTGRRRK